MKGNKYISQKIFVKTGILERRHHRAMIELT
jgi:hypothetical protein